TNNEDSPGASGQTTAQENSAALLEQQPANGSDAKAEGRNIVAYLKAVLSKIPKPGARQNAGAAGSLPVAAVATPAAAVVGEAAAGQSKKGSVPQLTLVKGGNSSQTQQTGAAPIEGGQANLSAAGQQAQAAALGFTVAEGGKTQQAAAVSQQAQQQGQKPLPGLNQQQNNRELYFPAAQSQDVQTKASQQSQEQGQAVQNANNLEASQSAPAQAAAQANAQQQGGTGQQTGTAGFSQNQQQNARQKEVQSISMAMATSQLQGGKAPSVRLALARFITSMAQNSPFLSQGQGARSQLVAQLAQQWLAENGTNFDSLSPARQRAFAAELSAIQKTLPGGPNGAASLAAALPVGEYAAPAAQSGGQGAQTLAAGQNPYALYASANGESGGPPVAQGPATQGANGENTAGGGKETKGKGKPKNQPNQAALAIMGVEIDGQTWNYTNPNGKLIHWTPQTQSDMQAKEGKIERNAQTEKGAQCELEAVNSIKEMLAEGALPAGLEIEGIDLQFKKNDNTHAGEIDI
ncbi:MAG: hypothetical protein ACK5L3_00235, partial [Oscillospiraceae bacterium]